MCVTVESINAITRVLQSGFCQNLLIATIGERARQKGTRTGREQRTWRERESGRRTERVMERYRECVRGHCHYSEYIYIYIPVKIKW